MSFFKLDGVVLEATLEVINKDYELYIDKKETYDLPIDGWYYFDTSEEAYSFFEVPYPTQITDL